MEKAFHYSHFNEPKINLVKASILIIDDSVDTLVVQKKTLELEGYNVFTSQSGKEGIALLGKIEEPNLLLLDMNLGDMSGTEFLKILEDTLPEIIAHVPIVFLTGQDEIPNSKAVGFIRKPVDRAKFIDQIHRYIEMGNKHPYRH